MKALRNVAATLLVFKLLTWCTALDLSVDEHSQRIQSINMANDFSREYLNFFRTANESDKLKEIGKYLRESHNSKELFTKPVGEQSTSNQFFICTMCRATVKVIANTFTSPDGELNGPNRDYYAKQLALGICIYLRISTSEVCGGIFDLNWPIIDYILNETIAEARSICGMLPIPICEVHQEQFNFTLTIDGADLSTEPNSELATTSENDPVILHLTDIHYDPEYVEGGLADCEEFLCCRKALPENSELTPSGSWSDYRYCDTPRKLIVNAFEHIKDKHSVDWIYHTGDVPPHNVWSTTKQGNIDMLTEIDALLVEYFPDTPIYSCLGNHEPHPTNVFGEADLPDDLNVKWLYELIWSLWSKWLPEDTKETILKGGYYTVSPSAGHRIIALNSMDCYLFNWWLFYDGSITIEQLNWLHDTLLSAEKAGEYVHILTHIPSGDSDCWTVWSREYNRILARFNKIITGIFNGHTHKDEMNLHYTQDGKPVAISWNGGSLTSYSNKNPNYRLYEVSADTWQVLEHQTWTFNLTAANENEDSTPEWYQEYYFTKEFTNDTSPVGIDTLLVSMAQQPELLRKYWRFKFTNADPYLQDGCDDRCLMSTICRLATTNYQDKSRCRELQGILEQNLDGNSSTTTPEPGDDGAATLRSILCLPLLLVLFIGGHFFQ